MPFASSNGIEIYFEEDGHGPPLLFLHELAGDHRSWAPQVSAFSDRYRCIRVAARGYPPSDVPEDEAAYGQAFANRDALAVLDHLDIDRAHVIGLSMGAYTALQLAMTAPERCRSVTAASGWSGSLPSARESFLAECRASAEGIEQAGRIPAEQMGRGPTRIQLFNKAPEAWRTFVDHLAEHPAAGAARTLRRVQAGRPALYDFEGALRAVQVPVLLLVGDEDESCLDVNLFLKRTMPAARLAILPGSGHVLNLEDPALSNRFVERFLTAVDQGTWRPRDPGAMAAEGAATALGLGVAPKA